MSDVRFTSGPWTAVTGDSQPSIFYRGLVATVERSPERWLSVVADCGAVGPDEWEGNTRLLAAAPDLLSALRAFLRMDDKTEPITAAEWNAAVVMGRAAIAKATGTAPPAPPAAG